MTTLILVLLFVALVITGHLAWYFTYHYEYDRDKRDKVRELKRKN